MKGFKKEVAAVLSAQPHLIYSITAKGRIYFTHSTFENISAKHSSEDE